ncbi:methyltransferase domain-containing protein [Rhodopseudomonas palustris]|uniref:class I SAM-dependent methyltransferase n=1 Tax=Rhodopseudomonas palustris TaxID=1076 RepID=UPI0009B630B7
MRADDRPSRGETHEGAEAVKFHLGDAENPMMPDERFDAVVSRHLVWTLPDPEAALADWLRVLRPGGRVVLVDCDWVHRGADRAGRAGPPSHHHRRRIAVASRCRRVA